MFALIGLGALHYLASLSVFGLSEENSAVLRRAASLGILLVLILGLARISAVYLIGQIDNAVSRYNLKRIQRLIVILLLTFSQ